MNNLLSEEDLNTEKDSIKYVKDNRKLIQERFADIRKYPSVENPVSIFLAGSPGAGKTEFAHRFIKDSQKPVVHIDPDEIRKIISIICNNSNATLLQRASALGVEKVYDCVIKNNQDVILDGTLIDYDKAFVNIERSIKHNRVIHIYYIYQDPILAWGFTKKREALEHRGIPKDFFIKAFFQAKNNVNKLKEEFGKALQLNLIIKNFENDSMKFELNIEKIDSYLKISYTKEDLEKLLN
ncbi:MAG: zeta toxin family protein [Candidatus Paceibacterota bacterium]